MELPLQRSRSLLPMRTVTSIQTTQSSMHPTPLRHLSIKSPSLHHYPKLPHHRSQCRTPLLRNRAHHQSKITFRHLLHTPFRSPGCLPHRPHLACDVSRPTSPFTPCRPLVAANFTSCGLRSQPFTRGISSTRVVPIAWTPTLLRRIWENRWWLFFEAGITYSGDRARRCSRGGRLPAVQSTSGGPTVTGEGGKVSSVPYLC